MEFESGAACNVCGNMRVTYRLEIQIEEKGMLPFGWMPPSRLWR